jgi:hypothetical protein
VGELDGDEQGIEPIGQRQEAQVVQGRRREGPQRVAGPVPPALPHPQTEPAEPVARWFVAPVGEQLSPDLSDQGTRPTVRVEAARQYWVGCLKKIKAATGLDAYLFDSFYNLGFMPVSYRTGHPTTQWRGLQIGRAHV